jgi:crotonobetainyl-CoA:carnitine CoA-transferase CaiB-like acyl-CoA transferase
VEASLLEGQVAAMSYHATGYMASGRVPGRLGSAHPSLVPYQAFPSSDGHFILGCANDGLWQRLCPAIGRNDLAEDERFKTNTGRVESRKEVIDLLSDHFRTKTTAEWVDIIMEAGVPCGPINRVSDVVNDPQVLARNMIVSALHPRVPEVRVPGPPLKLTDHPATVRRHPPDLGEHTAEVLGELGYSASEIEEMGREGVIRP